MGTELTAETKERIRNSIIELQRMMNRMNLSKEAKLSMLSAQIKHAEFHLDEPIRSFRADLLRKVMRDINGTYYDDDMSNIKIVPITVDNWKASKNPSKRIIITKKDDKITIPIIALIYRYNNISIESEEEAKKIASENGYKKKYSGRDLLKKYNEFHKYENRCNTDTFLKAKNACERLKVVKKHISEDNLSRIDDEIQFLDKHIEDFR